MYIHVHVVSYLVAWALLAVRGPSAPTFNEVLSALNVVHIRKVTRPSVFFLLFKINTRWMQDVVGVEEQAAQWFGKAGQNRCCQHHNYDRYTESSYCCSQVAPSQEDGIACFVFVLITTCSILNLVFELKIRLLYHSQLHMCACAASQSLHTQCS